MPTWVGVLILLVIVGAAVAAWAYSKSIRSRRLRSQFGPEYQRAVQEHGSRTRAESALEQRAKRVEHFDIHPLPPSERDRFAKEWNREQSRFVDEPQAAVQEADRLVTQVMKERGYPMSDFDRRAEDLSVDHPRVVENYRAACLIARRARGGQADTEELRQAMVHYRALFDELLEPEPARR
jgi:hypothetical protein